MGRVASGGERVSSGWTPLVRRGLDVGDRVRGDPKLGSMDATGLVDGSGRGAALSSAMSSSLSARKSVRLGSLRVGSSLGVLADGSVDMLMDLRRASLAFLMSEPGRARLLGLCETLLRMWLFIRSDPILGCRVTGGDRRRTGGSREAETLLLCWGETGRTPFCWGGASLGWSVVAERRFRSTRALGETETDVDRTSILEPGLERRVGEMSFSASRAAAKLNSTSSAGTSSPPAPWNSGEERWVRSWPKEERREGRGGRVSGDAEPVGAPSSVRGRGVVGESGRLLARRAAPKAG